MELWGRAAQTGALLAKQGGAAGLLAAPPE